MGGLAAIASPIDRDVRMDELVGIHPYKHAKRPRLKDSPKIGPLRSIQSLVDFFLPSDYLVLCLLVLLQKTWKPSTQYSTVLETPGETLLPLIPLEE